MKEELAGFHKVSIYGSRQEIDHATLWLTKLALTGTESQDRLLIQDCIDVHKLKASILYNGNTVRGYRKTIEDYKKLLKFGVESLTDYLYEFFHLQWTIAYYSKLGRIETYPNIIDVIDIVRDGTVPDRKTDVIRIREGLLSLS